jgi:hypothetical protein
VGKCRGTVGVTVGRTSKSIGLFLRAIIESLAGAANRFLYVLFNTTWSIVLFFAYWRNWALAPLILFAIAVDLIRTDRDLCRKLYFGFMAKRALLASGLVAALIAVSTIVALFDLREISFRGAFLHYEQAKLYTDLTRARIVYVVEATGVGIAFMLLIFFSVRQSAGETVIRKGPVGKQVFRELWVFLLFVALALTTLCVRVIDLWESASTINQSYRPGTEPIAMLLYSAIPVFFAIGMKFWLSVIYVMQLKADELKPK